MQFDPERGAVDWDGFFSFLLTLLLMTLGLGIPLMLSLRTVISTAASAAATASADQLLVFGKRLLNGEADADYRQRLLKAAELMRQREECRLLLVGGAGQPGEVSESAAGKRLLLELGIDRKRMTLEEQSQNTLENLRHARHLLQDAGEGPVAMISNRYHLARIHTMAQSLGLPHQLCGAESRYRFSWRDSPRLLAEAWYLLWFLTGRTWARLIRSRRLLERIT